MHRFSVLAPKTGAFACARGPIAAFSTTLAPRVNPTTTSHHLRVQHQRLSAPGAALLSHHRVKMIESCRHMASSSNPASVRTSIFGDQSLVGNDVDLAILSLVNADCVCFDVDSTVINEEGIDVLADSLGKGEQVAELTKAAMEGGMKFQDALAARLDLLQPSRQDILNCQQQHPLELTSGVAGFIESLHANNVDVYLVSGGFRIMIEPVAEILNIPVTNIVANTIRFDKDGKYVDFDPDEPTSQDMGKPKALTNIQAIGAYKTMVMIGDGATDAQAKPPASTFVGFGGVVIRSAVQEKADWFVTDFADLQKVMEYREVA